MSDAQGLLGSNVSIYLDDQEIFQNLIQEYKLTSDIDLPYSGGTLVISDIDGQFVSNLLFLAGKTIEFKFADGPGRFTWKGRIVSIEGLESSPTTKDSLGNAYSISFLHDYYFSQPLNTKGYLGKLSSILEEEISRSNYSFNNVLIETSDDPPTRYYQIQSRFFDFVYKSSVNTLIQDYPVIAVINDLNYLRFQSLRSIWVSEPIACLAPIQSPVRPLSGPVIPYSQVFLEISPNNEILTYVKSRGQIFNNETFTIESVHSLLSDFSGVYLIDKNFLNNIPVTKVFNFHEFSFLQNKARYMNIIKNFLSSIVLTVYAEESYGLLQSGSTVNFVGRDSKSTSENPINNNFSGKYLIKKIEHYYVNGKKGTLLTLVSPNLYNKTLFSSFGVPYNV